MDTARFRAPTDDELLATSTDSVDDFGEFYERTSVFILRYFLARTHDRQLSADLTAETYCAAFLARSRFNPSRGTAAAWLTGIARNQLRRFHRHGRADERARRRLGVPRLQLDDVSMERIDELLDGAAARGAARDALEQLPSGLAAAVRLRVIEEKPYEAVAKELGCSPGAARVRVSRGLDRLGKDLEEVDER